MVVSVTSSNRSLESTSLRRSEWGAIALPTGKLFGTDGIRGRAGDLLTAPLAMQIGFWAGQTLRDRAKAAGPVILGQDSRNSSHMLAMGLSAGLTAAGLEVWNLGLCPTPTVAYLTSILPAIGGVMISASHNPPEDNGIKFFDADGTKLSADLQRTIEASLRANLGGEGLAVGNFLSNQWGQHYYRPDLVSTYVESLHSPLLPSVSFEGMRVVLDLAWGAAVEVAPLAFRNMGAEVIAMHDRPDGDRINVKCGSTHLEALKAAVKSSNAHIGFAFDGDADRVMAVDANGRVVDGDYILYFWGRSLKSSEMLPNQTIISTVMANLGFERAWERQGGKLVRTPVGDQYVQAEMRRQGAMLGGEQSGHILCHHYGVSGDGLLTALHLAAMVRRSGNNLTELMEQSFQTYPQVLKNVRVEDRDRRLNWQQNDKLTGAIAQAEAEMGAQGRVLVRASGTEPVIRVMVEAMSDELTRLWTDTLVRAVEHYAAS